MGKPFVLIIEDERDVAALFRHVLDLAGYRTEIAANGKVAIERFAKTRPDVVLLDLSLPGISGAEVLQRMRSDERLRSTPVVVITAHSEIAVTLSMEPELVLLKPVNPDQLTGLVHRLVQNQSSLETTAFDDTPWDKSTGLYNRSFFETRLGHALENARENGGELFAVLTLSPMRYRGTGQFDGGESDLQNLQETTKLLRASVRPTDTIARLETGDFFILIENIPNADIAKIIAIRVEERLERDPAVESTQYGLAVLLCDHRYSDVLEILRDLEIASARANAEAEKGYMFFNHNSLWNSNDTDRIIA